MISRPSALAIATAYTDRFSRNASRDHSARVYNDVLYDFLFENNYEAWFCNLATSNRMVRPFKEFWLKIHTGESLISVTAAWSWDQRRKRGQLLLQELAKDHLNWYEANKHGRWNPETYAISARELVRRLELDGYVYRDGLLLQQQQDVLDVEQETGILNLLYAKAKLARAEDAFEFLRLSEEHFVSSRWSDCISNIRKFFELTLREGARALSTARASPLNDASLARPVEVRQYLEQAGIFERKERETVDKLYGLLSETGAHPYMAEADQARLLRQLSLTMVQFVLLRLDTAMQVPISDAS
ncbi:hypothetical protein [Stenotrophomonas rhizophila]